MNIFGGRPGIAAGVLAVIAILAAAFLSLSANITILILAFLFIVICIILCICKYITPYRLFANAAVILVFTASLIRGMDLFYSTAPSAQALCGEEAYIHATVDERRTGGDYYTVYTVRIHSVNGIEYDGKATLNCEYNSDLQEGYEFVLRGAEVEYTFALLPSDAVSLVAEETFLSVTSFDPNDCVILSEGNFTFFDRFESLNSYLCAKLRNGVKGEEGRLAAAMLLGDKQSLTSEMYRDFSRAGLSHYLAVSGLHVSIIMGIVSFMLLRLRIRRYLRNILLALFAVGYLFLLGFPISAVRSVMMLLVVFTAYSLGDSSDALNALGISAVIIILMSPTSVFDESFILSFSATLGIISFMPHFNGLLNKIFDKKKEDKIVKERSKIALNILKSLFSFVFGTLMSVSAALSLTLLPVALLFGETSVLGFRSNITVTLAALPLLAASLFYLLLGGVPYIGEALGFVIAKTARFMLEVSAALSDSEGALVSLASEEALSIVIAFSALICLLLIIKVNRKKLLLLAPGIYPLVLAAIVFVAASAMPNSPELTFITTGKDENILTVCRDGSAIIDISDGSLMRLRSIAAQAHEEGVTEFDTLILTHYHTRHLSSLPRFVAAEKVRRVLLPYPENEDDAWIMVQLADSMQNAGCGVEILPPEGDVILPGQISMSYPRLTRIARSLQPVGYLSFSDGDQRLTYVGGSAWENGIDFAPTLEELVNKSECVVIGAHGPVNEEIFDLPVGRAEKIYIFEGDLEYLIHPDSSIDPSLTVVSATKIKFRSGREE